MYIKNYYTDSEEYRDKLREDIYNMYDLSEFLAKEDLKMGDGA